MPSAPEYLLSVPPAMAGALAACEPRIAAAAFAACDPEGVKLGSGGGTAHLLAAAWRARAPQVSFDDWLGRSLKVVVHGGGESRRLPGYAASGKLFLPVPVYRWALGQRPDQNLFDLQRPLLDGLAARAAADSRVMIVSGDALLRSGRDLPTLPAADVVAIGLGTKPEEARHFGVFFCPHRAPNQPAFFLQKPDPDRIRELAEQYLYFIDTGVWLLSGRAVRALLSQCGWDPERQQFHGGLPAGYELYNRMGLHLGATPSEPHPEISRLSVALATLPDGAFYHFGNSRDIIESVFQLQNLRMDHTNPGMVRGSHPRQILQNAVFHCPLRRETNHTLWVENSHVPATWQLACEHVLTGVPPNDWTLRLEPGVCLDFVPVGATGLAVRAYGIADAFRGAVGDRATRWFNRPAPDWFGARGLTLAAAGLEAAVDLQHAPLFPVVEPAALDPAFIAWLFAATPADNPRWSRLWLEQPRLSASELGRQANLPRLYDQRRKCRERNLSDMARNYRQSVFYALDLNATAELLSASAQPLSPEPITDAALTDPLLPVHDRMFRAAVLRRRDAPGWEQHEQAAFALLRRAVVDPIAARPVTPGCRVLEDQIIWGRSPVRLDLAGGWTDTPPYCFEHGGRVVNVAVNLNGQPPIQVFARQTASRELVIRSIDLGLEDRVGTYDGVADSSQLQSGFSIARAAFALAGFHPRFNGAAYATLDEQLRALGGGVEISLLAAVPKGSGLGTSSILAATLLGTLSEFCGLDWDHEEIFRRTLALEQMLTSGGGWQDQMGGVLHGAKFIETQPGLDQQPTVRWLPGRFFDAADSGAAMLLYYTGIPRVAHNILKEIVRHIFLNDGATLDCVDAIGRNAVTAYDAIQRQDYAAFAGTVRRSWALNQRLDAGTNTPAIQALLAAVAPQLLAAKLRGAGGGGYLLLLARSADDARQIRRILTEQPPNPRARFVDFSLSTTGLQITRS
ncbi:MAG: bifunctional fucokinase/fucose-1-phosphate guanylyltransferase [Kiritimatiellaeota bacterium]|nr:bifunctional fucokinase/fucose-1-phosphate guanylyltransferase [Kiritimatiellota bacterium]